MMGAPVMDYGASVVGTQFGSPVDLGTAVVGQIMDEVPQMAVQQVEI